MCISASATARLKWTSVLRVFVQRRMSIWRREPRCWTAPTARSPRGRRRTPRSCRTTTAACTSPPWSWSPSQSPCASCAWQWRRCCPVRPVGGPAGGVLLHRRRPGVHFGHRRGPLKDLHVTIAVLLVVHSCNVGYTLVIEAADAEVRAPAIPGSNPARAGMGGNLIASANGMQFVVPVLSADPGPNRSISGAEAGDLAEHDQQPGRGAGREGGGWQLARIAACVGRSLRP